jgi:hypothetical protein
MSVLCLCVLRMADKRLASRQGGCESRARRGCKQVRFARARRWCPAYLQIDCVNLLVPGVLVFSAAYIIRQKCSNRSLTTSGQNSERLILRSVSISPSLPLAVQLERPTLTTLSVIKVLKFSAYMSSYHRKANSNN